LVSRVSPRGRLYSSEAKDMFKKLLILALLALSICWAPRLAQAAEPEHGGAAAKTEEASGEHPLIDLTVSNAIWTLILFIILLAVLYPTAWKQVLAGLKAREQRIRNDIAEAEAARAKAEATLKEYNAQLAKAEDRAREILGKATTDAENLATQIRQRAQKDSEETKDRATRDIEEAKNRALAEIYEQTASLATNVAEKILRRNLNPEDQRDLVAQSLDQLQSVNRG
jgi:F-type H+-transporting ATPase subunit b